MFLKRTLMLLALTTLICRPLDAQTVTVGAAGDYSTLQQAIDSFRVTTAGANASNPADNVIELLDNTTTETTRVFISPDITRTNTSNGLVIRSVAPQGFTVLVIPSTAATYETGMTTVGYFSIYNDGYAEVEGLRIIPLSLNNTRSIYIDDNPTLTTGTVHTILNDVWAMPNAGGAPASDGFTAPAGVTAGLSPNIPVIGVASAVAGRDFYVELNDVRASGGGFGLQVFNSHVEVGPGCVFSYAGLSGGIQVNQTVAGTTSFAINGTELNPVWILNNTGIGIDVGTTAASQIRLGGEWFRVVGNTGNGYDQSSGAIETISNSIFALNGGAGGNFLFYSTQDTTETLLTECTFFNATAASAPAFSLSGTGASPWTIEGSVFAANGSANDDLLYNTAGTTSTVTIRNSAIVTAGPNSLSLGDADGIRDADVTRFILEGSVIGLDPAFESVDPTDSNFLYVSNEVGYSLAGIAGGILRGGTNQLMVPVELSTFSIE